MSLVVGIIKGSLASYFPERHGVFPAVLTAVEQIASSVDARVIEVPYTPMDGAEARDAVEYCKSNGVDFILLVHGGFTMGDVAREIAASDMPMGVWATPEPVHENDIQLNNFVSLNMSLSIARGVRDLRRAPAQWYFGAPDSAQLHARLGRTFRALSARKALRHARVGVVGGLAPTFYNMAVSADTLKRTTGVEPVHIDMMRMTSGMAKCSDDDVAREVAAMLGKAQVRGVSDDHMAQSARAALSLRAIAAQEGFAGLAVSDWPTLQEVEGMHPGAAFTWLEEVDNMPVSSEGDVLGAVTQLVARALTGKVGCLLDMTSPQLEQNRILMWHGGGGPLYMAARDPAWINNPMIGRGTEKGPCFGAIVDYEFCDGPHTILRMARSGTATFTVEGSVQASGETGFSGTRGWITDFRSNRGICTASDVVTSVMEHGLEHHYVLVPGQWSADFNEFSAWMAMEQLEIISQHDGLPSTCIA